MDLEGEDLSPTSRMRTERSGNIAFGTPYTP